jgi:hypothetical protein
MSVGATERSSARRASIFKLWSHGGSLTDVGKALDLTRVRTHQIVWKAIIADGLRSKKARALGWPNWTRAVTGSNGTMRSSVDPANLYLRKSGAAPLEYQRDARSTGLSHD